MLHMANEHGYIVSVSAATVSASVPPCTTTLSVDNPYSHVITGYTS